MPTLRPRPIIEVPRWTGSVLPERDRIAKALLCPFPSTLNPNLPVANAHVRAWLDRFVVHSDPAWVERAKKAEMAWFISGFYPTARVEELCVAATYLAWAFGLDDVGDETAVGQRPERLLKLFDRYEDIFLGRPAGTESSAVALSEILDQLSKYATPAQLKAFHEGNRAYFGAMLWEANNRHGGLVPEEGMYVMLRPAAGAVPCFAALIEPVERIELSDDARSHPGLQRLVRLMGGILCFTNDVLSYEKERAKGDVHNLAYIYEHHRGLSPARAVAEAVGFNNASVADFLEEEGKLPSFGAAQDVEVKRYLAVLRSMIRVTLDWTLGSPRYSDPE
jgi:hypothetical protein